MTIRKRLESGLPVRGITKRLNRREWFVGVGAFAAGALARGSAMVAHATSGTSPEGDQVLGANSFTAGRTVNTRRPRPSCST